MDSEEQQFMQAKYMELKAGIQKTSTILHEFGRDIKERYHIGFPLEGSARSQIAKFRSCTHRDMGFKRAVKTYYIADGLLNNVGLNFQSHPQLNFTLIMNEIKALSELTHPNILRLYEVYFDSKYIHLVTEFCKGRELYDRLYVEGMTPENAVVIFIQILEGIKYMHSKGYVHRGLCIENVMFLDYEKKKIKIISFSGAVKYQEGLTEKYGSPMYMAPEVFAGNYDETCDVWSAGVIFFTMITGHQPFQSLFFNGLVKSITELNFIRSQEWLSTDKIIANFIKKILVLKNRPSAEVVLDFPLIRKHLNYQNKVAIKQLMRTVKSIKPESNFSMKIQLANKLRIIIYKILYPLNVLHDVASLERLWGELDLKNANFLMEKEIVNNIERVLNKQNMGNKAHQILKKFDLDKRGGVNKDEFIGLMCDISDKNLLMMAFNALDPLGKGSITPSDVDTYFEIKNYDNLEKLMVDAFDSTTLSYEDFYLLVTKYLVT